MRIALMIAVSCVLLAPAVTRADVVVASGRVSRVSGYGGWLVWGRPASGAPVPRETLVARHAGVTRVLGVSGSRGSPTR